MIYARLPPNGPDPPLVALELLMKVLKNVPEKWKGGALITAHPDPPTTVRIQRAWRSHLATPITYPTESIAAADYAAIKTETPSHISAHVHQSPTYIGRPIGTTRATKWHIQLPLELTS